MFLLKLKQTEYEFELEREPSRALSCILET